MTYRYLAPRLLERHHEVDAFACRSAEQTEWLRRHARQGHASGTARVLVVTAPDDDVVVAYYAWSIGTIALADAPTRLRKGAGRYPQPVALLARLGVSIDHERRGLLVHAESADARAFYTRLVPECEPSPTDELHMVLLAKDIRATLTAG